MKPNSSPDPSWQLQHYKQALLNLLAEAEEESDTVTDRFDQIIGKLERLVALLARHQVAVDNALGPHARGVIQSGLNAILKAARDGRRRAINASDVTEQVTEALDDPSVQIVPGKPLDPSAIAGPEVHSVVPVATAGNGAGPPTRAEFFVNGTRHTFSAAQGALFAALCADDGESDDRFVAFKSKQFLMEHLGIDTHLLQVQVHRLRNKLKSSYGFSRNLLETDPARGYRIRLVRKAP